MDISINKVFKDNLKLNFEENKLFFQKLEPKVKLQKVGLNLIDYFHQIWFNNSIINNKLIINGFNIEGIINKFYKTDEEKKLGKATYIFYYLMKIMK